MRFLAKLDPRSALFRRWRGESRVSGILHGVLFRWNGKTFVSEGEIPADLVPEFSNRHDKAVLVEAVGVLPSTAPESKPGVLEEFTSAPRPRRQRLVLDKDD